MTTAVLIDTISIQKYIFSSNKLRENLGASFIVANTIYNSNIKDKYLYNYAKELERGYEGGGNALLLFEEGENKMKSKGFIKDYSKQILEDFPGLKLAFAIKYGFDENLVGVGFIKQMNDLHKELRENKNLFTPITEVYKPGIAVDCIYSDQAAEVSKKLSSNENILISKTSAVKWEMADAANNYYNKYLLNTKFAFPTELNEMGQDDGKGYIAIVHIDGNGMGNQFKNATSLTNLRNLSEKVKGIMKLVFIEFINNVINFNFENNNIKLAKVKDKDTKRENGKEYLPIRPIILGGDDITFVCHGKLGIYLAEKFITIYNQDKDEYKINGKRLEACAGIAVVKTKFPFFKAYQEAEELIRIAKQCAKDNLQNKNEAKSYIAGNIINTGLIEEGTSFLYHLTDNKTNPQKFDKGIKEKISFFNNKKNNWSKSKIMELREILNNFERTDLDYFKIACESQDISVSLLSNMDINKIADFKQAIDIMDFYPITN